MTPADPIPTSSPAYSRLPMSLLVIATITLIWIATSALRAPVPAVNEPHYLGKAKFFWNPDWCHRDFFLQSSNPHAVFYAAVGWLTLWLPLPTVAWIARAAALVLLASGWQQLGRKLFHSQMVTVLAAALFALLQALGNFSGEWVIGGVEGKVFAYGFLLWSAAMLFDRRWLTAAALAGAGVSFHPLVGGWYVIALCIARAFARLTSNDTPADSITPHTQSDAQTTRLLPPGLTLAQLAAAAVLLVVFSLPGMIPSLDIVIGVDPEVGRQADHIVLTQRLGHHLDPQLFPFSAYRQYAMLLALWLSLRWVSITRSRLKAVERVIAAAILFAGAGLIAGWSAAWVNLPPDSSLLHGRTTLLKFYPFRMADIGIPFIVSLLAARGIVETLQHRVRPAMAQLAAAILAAAAFGTTLLLPAPDANASGMPPEDRADWIALCEWVRDNTPEDALVGTANESWAIKWFAHRAEYVSFKDCPQDAEGIVEWWNRRWRVLSGWSRQAQADGQLTHDELVDLHRRTGIDYFIVSRYNGFLTEPVFQKGRFRVYRIPHE